MSNLLKLAERVEAGEKGDDVIWDIFKALGKHTDHLEILIRRALDDYNALSAAQALHDAVLSGWLVVDLFQNSGGKLGWSVWLRHKNVGGDVCGVALTPAAAWVASILRAVHEVQRGGRVKYLLLHKQMLK